MEKRVRNLAIFGVSTVLLFMLFLVWYANRPAKKPDPVTTEQTETDDPYRAFLKDETFFDKEPGYSETIVTETEAGERGDTREQLYLEAGSVLKDIRIMVTDAEGYPVKGHAFYVNVDPLGDFKDLDRDGQIYIPDVEAGDYYAELKPVDGYRVPSEPMRISVKDQLEYSVIEDISLYIHSEDEVNVTQEDTRIAAAAEDADATEHTGRWEGTDAVFGIDVSAYQKDIDWQKVAAAGVEFAIIRCGYRGSTIGGLIEDSKFKQNIEGATAAGIPVGVYFFTQAVNEVEAVEEASMVVMLCRDYRLDYPVFIDVEGAGGKGRADGLDKYTRTNVVKAFCETIESAGLSGGVYSGRWWYNNNLVDDELQDYVHWLAEYRANPLYTGKFSIWQYSSGGNVDGINTRVDLDLIWDGR
ncbi:MAG: glycoside hydrolase family 25 protein [Lachnospiraceae bacterium]|nr:glycoside hydrolase family 25 protein [Lachnospiraceae bacterium]